MFKSTIFGLIAFLTVFVSVCNAGNFMLDSSCTKSVDTAKFVRDAMSNALKMAQAGVDAAIPDRNNPDAPVTEAIQNVLTWLFGSAGVGGAGLILGDTGQSGVLRFTTEVFDKAQLNGNDLKIYCDQSRVERRTLFPLTYFDKDVKEELPGTTYRNCHPLTGNTALMYTTKPRSKDGNNDVFWQVQICPFFLNYAMPAKQRWTTALTPDYWAKVTVTLIESLVAKFKFTAIDGEMLFDKVMLHELTHASMAYATYDLAYGWAEAVKLPGKGPIAKSDRDGYPIQATAILNADSWGLYGSIAWQLQTGKITAMHQDGTFDKPLAATPVA